MGSQETKPQEEQPPLPFHTQSFLTTQLRTSGERVLLSPAWTSSSASSFYEEWGHWAKAHLRDSVANMYGHMYVSMRT